MTGATTALQPGLVGGLHVWTGGAGRAVVLLHGLGGSAANWVEVVPQLLPRRRVLAVDLPGHGGSPAPRPGARVDDYAEAVADVIGASGCGRATLVGHSFGGQVAARLAWRWPGLVDGLLLACPSGVSSRRRTARLVLQLTTRLRPTRRVRPLALRYGDREWFRRTVFSPWLAGNVGDLSARAVRGLVWDADRHTDVGSASRAMTDDDALLWLGDVRTPSIVLWGARDVQLPLSDGYQISRVLRARLRVVAGCGHLVIVERPDAVVDALRAVEHATA